MHIWPYFMYAHGMKCVIVVACILNSYCMNFAACWSNTTHVKACNMRAQGMQHVFCILLCLVCVCVSAFCHFGMHWLGRGDFFGGILYACVFCMHWLCILGHTSCMHKAVAVCAFCVHVGMPLVRICCLCWRMLYACISHALRGVPVC